MKVVAASGERLGRVTRVLMVTAITEQEGAELVSRPGAHPCVDDLLAGKVRAKIGKQRGSEPPEIALGVVGGDEWLVYVLDDAPAGNSGIFRVTLREPSELGAS